MMQLLPNVGTLSVLALVIVATALAIRSLHRNRSKGCSCGCDGCSRARFQGACHRQSPH